MEYQPVVLEVLDGIRMEYWPVVLEVLEEVLGACMFFLHLTFSILYKNNICINLEFLLYLLSLSLSPFLDRLIKVSTTT